MTRQQLTDIHLALIQKQADRQHDKHLSEKPPALHRHLQTLRCNQEVTVIN